MGHLRCSFFLSLARCLFTHSNTTHVCFFSIPFPETASPHQPLIDHLLPPQPRASADFHCVIPSSPWAHSLPSEPPRPPGCDAALPSRALWCHGLSQMQLASAACFVSARAASSLRQAMMHCLSCASQMQLPQQLWVVLRAVPVCLQRA